MTAKPKNETGGADKAVHLVYGEDEYLVSTNAKELVDRLCPKADQAFGLEIVDARVGLVDEAFVCWVALKRRKMTKEYFMELCKRRDDNPYLRVILKHIK